MDFFFNFLSACTSPSRVSCLHIWHDINVPVLDKSNNVPQCSQNKTSNGYAYFSESTSAACLHGVPSVLLTAGVSSRSFAVFDFILASWGDSAFRLLRFFGAVDIVITSRYFLDYLLLTRLIINVNLLFSPDVDANFYAQQYFVVTIEIIF